MIPLEVKTPKYSDFQSPRLRGTQIRIRGFRRLLCEARAGDALPCLRAARFAIRDADYRDCDLPICQVEADGNLGNSPPSTLVAEMSGIFMGVDIWRLVALALAIGRALN